MSSADPSPSRSAVVGSRKPPVPGVPLGARRSFQHALLGDHLRGAVALEVRDGHGGHAAVVERQRPGAPELGAVHAPRVQGVGGVVRQQLGRAVEVQVRDGEHAPPVDVRVDDGALGPRRGVQNHDHARLGPAGGRGGARNRDEHDLGVIVRIQRAVPVIVRELHDERCHRDRVEARHAAHAAPLPAHAASPWIGDGRGRAVARVGPRDRALGEHVERATVVDAVRGAVRVDVLEALVDESVSVVVRAVAALGAGGVRARVPGGVGGPRVRGGLDGRRRLQRVVGAAEQQDQQRAHPSTLPLQSLSAPSMTSPAPG